MNIRQAILSAASFIESHPKQFNFFSVSTPSRCGTPACALGWIGYFAGHRGGLHRVVLPKLGLSEDAAGAIQFYERCNVIGGMRNWRESAEAVVATLRGYADKFHPSEGIEEVRGIPASVRNIFTLTNAQLREALDA